MANETMTLISTVTVGAGGAASMTFSSIAGTFTDLQLVVSARTAQGAIADGIGLALNNSFSSISQRLLYGTGTSAGSETSTVPVYGYGSGNTVTSNTFGSMTFYIPNYAGSTNKSVSVDSVGENNAAAAFSSITAGLWSNTAAVTSLVLVTNSGANFQQYSTASLYGILKGSGGASVS